MTRRTWGPPPELAALGERAVHLVVRDYPETLGPLRALGLDPQRVGTERLGRAAGERLAEVLAALDAALAWRRRP